jgi:cytoskeletal protein CcmA (bactofilin family)
MASNRDAVIQEDTTIVGKIRNCREIEIRGYVEGDLQAESVVVREQGRLHGKIKAGDADVFGTLQGEVNVKNLITIRSSGSVNGNVQYGQLAMEMGGDLSAELRNAPPRLAGDLNLSVARGRAVLITTEDVNAIDPDDDAQSLTCSISNITNGFVALSPAKSTPVRSFTQADIEAGRVYFVHDGSGGDKASFDIVVSDASGAVSGAAQTVAITVTDKVR